MKKIKSVKALLLTFCAVGVLAAANQSWADTTITNCAQVSAAGVVDTDSTPGNKASDADILAAVTGATNEDDEACAPLTVQSIFDLGDAPDTYGTTGATAAKHEIVPGLLLGSSVDDEADGQPDPTAQLDGSDEDGVNLPALTDGQALTLTVNATNTTDTDATVGCWIDYDGNGTFDSAEFGGATVPKGSTTAAISVVMPAVPADASSKLPNGTYARCRLSTDTIAGNNAVNAMTNGEVEDYKVTIAAAPVFDLALTKRLSDGQATSAKAGETVKFTVEVRNQGTVEAKDVVVSDYIPTGLVLADANWTASGSIATLNTPIASLAAGATTTVEISFTVDPTATAGDLTNTAEISSAKDSSGNPATDVDSTMDANVGNEKGIVDDVTDNTGGDEDDSDIAKITITVDPKTDVELLKTVADDKGQALTTVRRGDTVVYTLTATNKGPDAATGVVVKDQLPAGLVYVSDDSAGAYVSASGLWTIGDIANGESKVLKITAKVK